MPDRVRLFPAITVLLLIACGASKKPMPMKPASAEPRAGSVDETTIPRSSDFGEIHLQTFALICPAGTLLAGAVPPEGKEAWCRRDETEEFFGPAAVWSADGRLLSITMYSETGVVVWTLSCDLASKSSVVAKWRGQQGEILGTFQARRCEDVLQEIHDE